MWRHTIALPAQQQEAVLDVVVFDLEFTAWEGSMQRNWSGPGEHREVVELGAVRARTGQPLADAHQFSRLVLPRINPQLSDYFTDLTNISQAELDAGGQPFEEVLHDFLRFANGADLYCSYGDDAAVLAENCQLSSIAAPPLLAQMRNIRPAVKEAYGLESRVTSSDLPAAVGMATVRGFKAHRALDDALAVATVLLPLLAKANFKVA